MWKIKHIFDGDYGCEERQGDSGLLMVSVTLVNEVGEEKRETVPDVWLTKNHLDIGSDWPDYSNLVIETKDLYLKKAQFQDWKDIYQNLWCHDESAKYMLWEPTKSEKDAIARMEKTVQFQKANKYALLIYEKESGQAIGFAGMKEIEPGVYEDTGVAFGPAFTGKGYGTQVLNAFLEEAKKSGAHTFVASCRTQNIASHNLQMKCGFEFSHFEDRIDPRDDSAYVLEFNKKKW